MPSTFSGLNAARSGLNASQTSLDITSQNIANANTTGYTRQVLSTASMGPGTGAYRMLNPNPQAGGGVDIIGISQIRNSFLDLRYRNQNSVNSDWQQTSTSLGEIETIVNEFASDSSDNLKGVSGQLKNLIDNLQSYSNTPDDANLPTTIKSSFDTLCQTIRTDYSKLQELEAQDKQDLSITVSGSNGKGGINGILDSITSLNRQIASYEITGQAANDLRDQRNVLLDQLSGYVDINVTEQSNGMVTVKLQNDSTHMLVDSTNTASYLELNSSSTKLQWASDHSAATIGGGSVNGYLKTINGDGTGSGAYGNVGIQAMYKKMDDFANTLVSIVNGLATANGGAALLQTTGSSAAASVDLSAAWKGDNSLFAKNYTGADRGTYVMSYKNALNTQSLSTMTGYTLPASASIFNGSLLDYGDTVSMDIANQVSYTNQMAKASKTQLNDLDSQRKSISSVSIDEEGINIVKYTQSYNAAARVITAVDQMLDKLINGTGIVGLS